MVDEQKETAANEGAAAAGSESSVLDEATRRVREQNEEKVPHTLLEEKSLPEAKRQIVVDITREEWDRRLGELFKDLQQSASIEGFRKGKAPKWLLQRRYTKEANNDVAEKAIPSIVREYQEKSGTTFYGSPRLVEVQTDSGKDVRLTIELEVKPEIEPKDYTGLEVEVEEVQLKADAVDARIQELRQGAATFEEVDRPATETDAVVLDIKAVDVKGQTVDTVNSQLFDKPHDQLPHDIAHEIVGKKAGESFEKKITGARKPGEMLRYTVNVRTVKELKLPELDNEFAKDLGYDDLAAMRKTVEESYERMVKNIQDDDAFDALMAKLADAHEFEIPAALKTATEQNMMQSDLDFMSRTGMVPARWRGRSREQYFEELNKNASVRVKAYLLADAIGKKENIDATEEDINAALEERAKEEGRKAPAIRAALERRREFDRFVEQVKFNKIRGFLLSKTTVKLLLPKPQEEIPAEETK